MGKKRVTTRTVEGHSFKHYPSGELYYQAPETSDIFGKLESHAREAEKQHKELVAAEEQIIKEKGQVLADLGVPGDKRPC